MTCWSHKPCSASRIRSILAFLVVAFLLCVVDAGTGKGRGRKSKPSTNRKSSSRKKEGSRKQKGSHDTHAPTWAPSTTDSAPGSLSPSVTTESIAPSNLPNSYPSQEPAQPSPGNDLPKEPTHDVTKSISFPLPSMQMDISVSAGEQEIDKVGFHQVFHSFLTEHFGSGSLSKTFDYLELDMWATNTTELTFMGDIFLFTKEEPTIEESIKTNLITLFSFWGNEELKIELRDAGIPVSSIVLHIDGDLVITNDGLLGISDDETKSKNSSKPAIVIPTVVLSVAFFAIAVILFRSKSITSRIDDVSIEKSTTDATLPVRIGHTTESRHASMSLEDNRSLSNSYDSIPVYRFEESANETDSRLLDSVIRSPQSCRYDPRRLDRVISKARLSNGEES